MRKIICTLGPATEKAETIRQLVEKGTDVFRLNMSHASHEWVRKIVPRGYPSARRLASTNRRAQSDRAWQKQNAWTFLSARLKTENRSRA